MNRGKGKETDFKNWPFVRLRTRRGRREKKGGQKRWGNTKGMREDGKYRNTGGKSKLECSESENN